MNKQSITSQKGKVMSIQFPDVSSVFLGNASKMRYKSTSYPFRRLKTRTKKGMQFPVTEVHTLAYLLARQYLQFTNDKHYCPFTSMLEMLNGYFLLVISYLPDRDQLLELAHAQEMALEFLVKEHNLQEVRLIYPITTVIAFDHPDAHFQSFLDLLEDVRVSIRSDMILRKHAVAIAHPLHPLGGNEHGTEKRFHIEEPLFVSPIPLMDMRYLHPMDARFMYKGEDKRRFESVFPPSEYPNFFPQRTFHRDYTAEELNRGEGMQFHPVNGMKLSELSYSESGGHFYSVIFIDFWFCPIGHNPTPVISDGKGRKSGDAYPAHWKYDPFTGEKLVS